MRLQQRIEVLFQLRNYLKENGEQLQAVKNQAFLKNNWFIPEFIEIALNNILEGYLSPKALENWVKQYGIPEENNQPKKVGIVMAGNIPLVGFHDMLSVFITGNKAIMKLSSKDEVLLKHLVQKMIQFDPQVSEFLIFQEMLKDCEAYIATGSNNSSRYFEHYFSKFPHIIRKNRTSVAILNGSETAEELSALADDVFLYFGMGCRNVTKIYVPENYEFIPLIEAFKKYDWLADHHKFKNNYDYQLAVLLLNKQYYMSTASLLLSENDSIFSPISQLHYEFYSVEKEPVVNQLLEQKDALQCIVGQDYIPFGQAQQPQLDQYADGVDTLAFLLK